MTKRTGNGYRSELIEAWSFRAALAGLLSVLIISAAPASLLEVPHPAGTGFDDYSATLDGVRVAVRVDHRPIKGWTVMPPPGAAPLPEPSTGSCADYLRALRDEEAVFVSTMDLVVEVWAAENSVVLGIPEFTLTELTLRQPYEAEAVTCLPRVRDVWDSDLTTWWPHTTVGTSEEMGRTSYRSAAELSASFVPFEIPAGHVHAWPLTLRAGEDWVMGTPELDLAVNGRIQRLQVPASDGPISLNSGFHDHQWDGRTERIWCEQADGAKLLEIEGDALCPSVTG